MGRRIEIRYNEEIALPYSLCGRRFSLGSLAMLAKDVGGKIPISVARKAEESRGVRSSAFPIIIDKYELLCNGEKFCVYEYNRFAFNGKINKQERELVISNITMQELEKIVSAILRLFS